MLVMQRAKDNRLYETMARAADTESTRGRDTATGRGMTRLGLQTLCFIARMTVQAEGKRYR